MLFFLWQLETLQTPAPCGILFLQDDASPIHHKAEVTSAFRIDLSTTQLWGLTNLYNVSAIFSPRSESQSDRQNKDDTTRTEHPSGENRVPLGELWTAYAEI